MVQVRKGPVVRCTPAKIGSPRANHSFRSLNHSIRSGGGRPPGLRTPGLRNLGGLRSCANSLKSSEGSGTNVRVVVRVRPPNKKEEAANAKLAVSVIDDKMLIFDPKEEEADSFFFRGTQQKGRDMLKKQHKNTEFIFDRVFGYASTNQQVFEESTKEIITHVLDGYNCSVFVYGATGAGKTFTMLGSEENPGVMFLTMVNLFERIEELKNEREIEMAVSYLEVYNENVFDLIVKSQNLFLREDSNGVVVSGLKVEKITSTSRLFELLAEGNKNRTQHPTDANAESSRSHAVFQVYLKMCDKGSNRKKIVKLSMIDLAGSERGSATNFAGARFKEGSSINKSLLALGNCINKLADGLTHIPYRDSKLTRILKDSLSGNCRTVMIANVSPSSLSYEDTHNTLRYAKRAKLIKSVIKKNIVSVEMHVSHYIKMVDDLKEENARLKQELEKTEAALEASKVTNAANPDLPSPTLAAAADRVPPQSKTSPKADNASLVALMSEVERIFSEKEDLQKRYLQMDSNEKILKFRMQCKERSVARVQQLCETPTNTDEAKFRAGRSLKQFTGQLKSALGCQEGLADQRLELDDRLEKLRQKAEAMGLLDHFLEKTARLHVQFQNVELKEQLTHLNRVMVLINKEKDDQDQVMAELSAAFRRYYNLLRGHGHMTDAMLREHKSLVRRLEGLKNVNWDTEEKASPPLKQISKLSLTDNGFLSPASPLLAEPRDLSPMVYRSTTCDIAQLRQDLNLIGVELAPQIEDVRPPPVLDSSGDEDFCVSGKFAQFNATFERLSDINGIHKIDATISKVDNLLNESSSDKGLELNRTYNAELNNTYNADLNNTYNAELNKTYELNEPGKSAEPAQSIKSADPIEPFGQTLQTLPRDAFAVDLNSTYELVKDNTVPTFATAETTVVPSQPSVVRSQSTIVPSQPAASPSQAAAVSSQYQPSVVSSQPSVVSSQPSVVSSQPTVVSFQPTVVSSQPAVVSSQPAVVSFQPTVVSSQPTVVSSQPTVVSSQPTVVSSQPTVVSSQPTVVRSQPKAMPSTCLAAGTKNVKMVASKRPLQDNNFPRPKTLSQGPKWRTPALSSLPKGAPISSRTILERKSPINPVKPKTAFGNKENGTVRRPTPSATKFSPIAGGPRFTVASSSHPKANEVFTAKNAAETSKENVRKRENLKKIGVSALVLCLNKL